MSVRILQGDCREVLPTLAAGSVHCVVTSPPYYGLRDYGVVGQLGLEASPDAYIAQMVAVFREVRRVLRDDGTCWVNMGDSYSSGLRTTQCDPSGYTGTATLADGGARRAPAGIGKPKDLLMMPARLALALQADGWWLRSDIIWHKPNPMPESVTDRPTSAHEHVFLLSKSARYFYDAEAVRETAEYGYCPQRFGHLFDKVGTPTRGNNSTAPGTGGTRNSRNVWTIATEAFPEAHFATFPTELAARCIRAGTSERGCCAQCGKPWVRNTNITRDDREFGREQPPAATSGASNRTLNGVVPSFRAPLSITTGWSPGCGCNAEAVPCTVLDPFAGAGTTLLVADRLQRNAVGIELNAGYVAMAERRIASEVPLFMASPAPVPDAEAVYDRQADLFAAAAD